MIVPIVRYVDTDTALRFLTEGLGFEIHGDVAREGSGQIVHAELHRGDSFVMLSNAAEPMPREVYVTHDDPDAGFSRAVAAGAAVVYEPKDQPYGAREFAVTDPEGTTWYVGTYRPGA